MGFHKFICIMSILLVLHTDMAANASNIILLPLPWPSHVMQLKEVGKQLQKRGHQVTILLPSKETDGFSDNTETLDTALYYPEYSYDALVDIAKENIMKNTDFGIGWMIDYSHILKSLTEHLMESKQIWKLIRNADLLVGDTALLVSPLVLAGKFNVQTVLFSSYGFFPGMLGDLLTNLETPSYIPVFMGTSYEEKIGLPQRMNFLQRSYNVLMYFLHKFVRNSFILFIHDPISRTYTNKTFVELYLKHTALVLVPTDFSVDYSRPVSPMVKVIGPLSVKKANELLQPFYEIFQASNKNVIVVSFGAMDILHDTWVKEFVLAFTQLNYTIIWRFNKQKLTKFCSYSNCNLSDCYGDTVENKGRRRKGIVKEDMLHSNSSRPKSLLQGVVGHSTNKCSITKKQNGSKLSMSRNGGMLTNSSSPLMLDKNVYIFDKIPQNDILGHPKTALFLSHCGTNSMYEAVYHGIPLVCIPLFGDHFDNAGRVVSKGLGEALEKKDVNGYRLIQSIKNVVTNVNYKKNMERASKRLKNRRQSSSEEAAEWIEMVIGLNGDTGYLRPVGADLAFYVYFSLDVIVVWSTLVILVLRSLSYCIFLLRSINLPGK